MKARKLLIATALAGTLGVISCKQRVYANTKKPSYPDAPAADAGTADAGPSDAVSLDGDVVVPDPGDEIHANPKGAFYDDGLAKEPKGP